MLFPADKMSELLICRISRIINFDSMIYESRQMMGIDVLIEHTREQFTPILLRNQITMITEHVRVRITVKAQNGILILSHESRKHIGYGKQHLISHEALPTLTNQRHIIEYQCQRQGV